MAQRGTVCMTGSGRRTSMAASLDVCCSSEDQSAVSSQRGCIAVKEQARWRGLQSKARKLGGAHTQ